MNIFFLFYLCDLKNKFGTNKGLTGMTYSPLVSPLLFKGLSLHAALAMGVVLPDWSMWVGEGGGEEPRTCSDIARSPSKLAVSRN